MAQNGAVDRFTDASKEPTKTLTPIVSYEKAPLLPLKEAAASIDPPVYNLQTMVWTAERNCADPTDGLTPDESASIHLYTMEWPESHESIYYQLNEKLRSEKRNELRSWHPYIKLFLTALYKLPSLKTIVWRGIRGNVSHLYKRDFIWWGISSCTESMEVMEKFIGRTGVRTLFMIECVNGKSIKSHSHYQDENEILLMPGTYFRVIDKWSPSDDLYMIKLKEETPPFELVASPFGPSLPSSVDSMSFNQLTISKPETSTNEATSAQLIDIMVSTETKANKVEGDLERYHQEILKAILTDDVKRLNDILDELDRCEPSTMKKEVLNMACQQADGLTALNIAAAKKHKSITEILAACPEVEIDKASLSGFTPLLLVAEVGWPDILDTLLQRGAAVDATPSGKHAEDKKIAGATPLIGATKYNHPECVKRLLAHHANPNHQNQSGISALMVAAEQGYFECVQLLVEAGADLELAPSGPLSLKMNLSGQTPLFCAAKEGRTEIVKYLLDHGANPRVQNHNGVSALWISAQRGLLQVAELFLDAGADIDAAPNGNTADELNIADWTPLYAAIGSRQFDIARLLLKRRANPNAVNKLGSTPFLLASEICDLDIVEACVDAGADLEFAPSGPDADNLNITGQTALFVATLKHRVDVVQYLISKGAQVNVQNRYGVSPLLFSAEAGNLELVQALVQAGADVNITPHGELAEEKFLAGQTPLHGAAKKGHVDICEYLISNGADVNAMTMTGATPLYTATEEGHLDIVKLLVRHGADVNRAPEGPIARDLQVQNQTPLLVACMKNHTAVIRFLVESGADVNIRSERGSSPLLAICQHNNVELARLLLKHGAKHDAEARNLHNGKINGLIVAAESGSFDILQLLVEAGLDVNYRIEGEGETAGRTPLFCACAKGFQNIVKYLIERGADVNATEKSGISCLHIASTMGHADTVKILCERGANVGQQFHFQGQDVTAYELAASQKHDHVCEVLKKFGPKKNRLIQWLTNK